MSLGSIKVVEYFLSWQGEGRSMGTRAWFFRFPGCNLRCFWCDTKYTWGNEELVEVKLPFKAGTRLVVITGGEPLADWNRGDVVKLVENLEEVEVIEIETNGTFPPLEIDDSRVSYVVSPKPGYVQGERSGIVHDSWFGRRDVIWKFVLGSVEDRVFIEKFVNEYKLKPKDVWIMPRGSSVVELFRSSGEVVEFAKMFGFNISLRLHVVFGFEKEERRWRDG